MGIFGSIVEPAASLLTRFIPNRSHCGLVGSETICHDYLRATLLFHRLPQKFQRSLAILLLGDEYFKDFTLVVNRPPKVVGFAIDPHENFVEVPPPLRQAPHRR